MRSVALAERLRVLRAKRGLGLVEAAKRIGVERHTLRGLERGDRPNPRQATLEKIARFYDVPVEVLLVPDLPLPHAEEEERGPAEKAEPSRASGVPVVAVAAPEDEGEDEEEVPKTRLQRLKEERDAAQAFLDFAPTLLERVKKNPTADGVTALTTWVLFIDGSIARVLDEPGMQPSGEDTQSERIVRNQVMAAVEELVSLAKSFATLVDQVDLEDPRLSPEVAEALRSWLPYAAERAAERAARTKNA